MVAHRRFVLGLGLALLFAAPLLAREVHEGRILAVGESSITLRDRRDQEDDKIEVTADTKITRNGKPAKLSELAAGDKAKVEVAEAAGKLTAKSIQAFMPE